MKILVSTFITVFLFSSCVTSVKTTDTVGALSLSPELILDMTMLGACDIAFWQSDYGRWVSEVKINKPIDVELLLKSIAEKPRACSLAQAIGSVRVINKALQSLKNSKMETRNSTRLKDKLRSIQQMLTKSELTIAELLVGVVFLQGIDNHLSASKDFSEVFKEIKGNVAKQQDDLISRAIKYDILIIQSLIYRMELLEWRNFGLSEIENKIPTKAELEEYSKYNKYSEIQKVDEFKKTLLENLKCLANQTCHLCYTVVQAAQCTEEKITEQEKLSKHKNSYFLVFLAPKYQDAIVRFKKTMQRFESQ